MKLTEQDIINYLTVNQNQRKRVILSNIQNVLIVNELLNDEDISTLLHSSSFYDALYDHNIPFKDVLNDYFMNHLDIEENSNDVMCWLHSIYA